MAKKAKAQAKREKKSEDPTESDELEDEIVDDGPKLSNEEIMAKVADLHVRYDDGQMELDDFDDERADLMSQISID